MGRERLLWVLGALVVMALGYGYAYQRHLYVRYLEFRENEIRVEAVRNEIEALKERVKQAQERIENLETDPVEMEAAIRRIRRLTRDGEVVFRIEEEEIPLHEGQRPETRPTPPTEPTETHSVPLDEQ